MEFKVLSKTDNTVISVANIGNDCIVSKATYGLGSGILTDTITFVPRMNIGYCIDGQDVVPKLKITGIPETATQSYTFTDENVMCLMSRLSVIYALSSHVRIKSHFNTGKKQSSVINSKEKIRKLMNENPKFFGDALYFVWNKFYFA